MIQTSQTHPNNEDHRQIQIGRQIRRVDAIAKRHDETADAFHQHRVRQFGKLIEALPNHIQIDIDIFIRRRDVRRNRLGEKVAIQIFADEFDATRVT